MELQVLFGFLVPLGTLCAFYASRDEQNGMEWIGAVGGVLIAWFFLGWIWTVPALMLLAAPWVGTWARWSRYSLASSWA